MLPTDQPTIGIELLGKKEARFHMLVECSRERVEAAVSATLDFWLTLGQEGDALQRELAASLGVRNSLLVNSGSSANLVALSALTSPKLQKQEELNLEMGNYGSCRIPQL